MKTWQHDETGRTTNASECPGPRWAEVPGAVERLRNGGQPDLADQVDTEIREAYAAGRRAVMEHLERIGAVADCPSCGGRGERMVAAGYGPDVYQDLENCPDCNGTGYALGLQERELPRASDLPVGSMNVRDHCTETQWNSRRNDLADGKYLVYVVRTTR